MCLKNRFTVGEQQKAEQAGVRQPTEAISICSLVNDLVQYKNLCQTEEEFIGQLKQPSPQLQELKETLLKGEILIHDAIGDRKILPNADCNVSMNGTLIESRLFSEVRFVTVSQTSLNVEGEDFRYLRIRGSANIPITVAKPDSNF